MTTAKPARPESWPHQAKALEFIREKPGAMLAMEMGTGKDLDDDTIIPTPQGWTRMGDLQPGDRVFDESGTPTTVQAVYPQGIRQVHRITFDDGAVLDAGDEHLWLTLDDTGSRAGAGGSQERIRKDWASRQTPVTTMQIRDSLEGTGSQHAIPLTRPLDLPERELPLDPHLVGLRLAEAAASPAGIRDYPGMPPEYLRASRSQRTRLLLGLLRDESPLNPKSGETTFTTWNEPIARECLELALSLGLKATRSGNETGWTVSWPAAETGAGDRRYIRSVTPMGTRNTTCITVDSPSGLFLAGSRMAPTHNTRVAIDLLDEMDEMDEMDETRSPNTLVLCPLSVADHVWEDQISAHSQRRYRVVPLGSRAGTIRKKAETFRKEFEKAKLLGEPLVAIVNYESAWREPLASILKSIRWSLFIMDESHRIKGPGGRASRFASQIADRSRRRLALTGTPMPHSPLDIYAQYRAIDKAVFGVDYLRFKDRYTVNEELSVRNSAQMRLRTGEQTREIKRTIGYKNEDELNGKVHSLAFVVAANEVLDLPETVNSYHRVPLAPRARRIHNQLAKEFRAEVDAGRITNATNALTKLLRLQQITSGFAVTENEETKGQGPGAKGQETIEVDHAKADALADILEDLPSGENVVVFARFIHDLDVVHRVAGKAGRDSWELSGRRRQLDDWKREGGVLATQIQTGSIGIDMTEARCCVCYSLGDYLQSRARVHRPGQTRDVHYIHLIAAGTVDEQVMGSLRSKEDVVERILRVRDLNNQQNRSMETDDQTDSF